MKFVLLFAVVAFLSGCGGATTKRAAQTTAAATSSATTSAGTTTATSPSPLQAEAKAAATGDVPDNQVFLRYTNTTAGYTMKYPEGWARKGASSTVTIRDKNNIIRVVVGPGAAASLAEARRGVGTITQAPHFATAGANRVVALVYKTQSAADPVTGKRLTLIVDRYYLWHGGKRAVVDLGTPQGVDNVDAYRLIIDSFTWK